jgi:hypothetical protein
MVWITSAVRTVDPSMEGCQLSDRLARDSRAPPDPHVLAGEVVAVTVDHRVRVRVDRPQESRLAVMSSQVGQPGDGCGLADRGVGPVVVVIVQERR